MQFDHLPENEQRIQGILKHDESYIPKKCLVSYAGTEFTIRAEAKKCQLVCIKCHLIETIRRESPSKKGSIFKIKKLNYVNNLKKKGCVSCGYQNNDLPRFFHFDHLEPINKIESISYTYDEMLSEIEKCQLLCANCHTIKTNNQRNNGDFDMLSYLR